MKYKAYSLHNFRTIPEVIQYLPEEEKHDIEVVGHVLPFKVNNYVIDKLIQWDRYADDPMFRLTFPHRDMLQNDHYELMDRAIRAGAGKPELTLIAHKIRKDLNPHPAGQLEYNVPMLDGERLTGLQHKYQQTVLFFPQAGQTCHAYCTFCFRWPQFVGMSELKFAMKETESLVRYIKLHPEVTDLLVTGGDPLIMSTKKLALHLEPLIDGKTGNLSNIRLGTKALGYWPYRFTTDKDADELLRLFEKITASGKHLALMAHFNHPAELETPEVKTAVERIRNTGAEIRTQSPLMRHINDRPDVWRDMWKKQVRLGMIPYYFFLARDTGAHDYFAVPLVRSYEIFKKAYQQVSGLARTVRGPSMSASPGKVQILGVQEVAGEKIFVLRFLQARNPDWVHRPFFARFDPKATWLDELQPAFGKERFFFEEEANLTPALNS